MASHSQRGFAMDLQLHKGHFLHSVPFLLSFSVYCFSVMITQSHFLPFLSFLSAKNSRLSYSVPSQSVFFFSSLSLSPSIWSFSFPLPQPAHAFAAVPRQSNPTRTHRGFPGLVAGRGQARAGGGRRGRRQAGSTQRQHCCVRSEEKREQPSLLLSLFQGCQLAVATTKKTKIGHI